ncbi:MAG: hypothetical protein WCQ53_07540 [bacterium]
MFDDIKYKIQEKWTAFIGNSFFENLRIKYESLPAREQRLIKVSSIGLAIFLILYMVYSMMMGISQKESKINEAVGMAQKLDELNDYVTANDVILKKKKKTAATKYVSLYDLVNGQEIAAKIMPESRVEIKEQPRKEVKGAKFLENTANVKYSKISIKQLKELLLGIETNESTAKIVSLKITRRTDDIRYIDAEFEVISRTAK